MFLYLTVAAAGLGVPVSEGDAICVTGGVTSSICVREASDIIQGFEQFNPRYFQINERNTFSPIF